MGILSVQDTDDAVSSMMALRGILTSDLEDVERLLRRTLQIPGNGAEAEGEEMEGEKPLEVYQRARTTLLSGIASIDEVLAWVHLVAAKDPEGNELDCVRSLPSMTVSRLS
ncbi:hypothetical protein [Noviherbaspirillum massiliense]|uniref:hypothetical protein n=1 Tax=Noviherbaspirillum massiliense TaxID=1465823 RepID=UPI0002DFC7A1|nr:hypothetical protein [Noviherbaspirillum massiliense]